MLGGLITTTSSADVSAPAAAAEAPESGGSSEGGGGGDVAVAGGFSEEGERHSGGNRWPRQETLALLRIRSEMDIVFRDSSLKGPLWEEVSRKLGELGYHRSAKKCKEKFENVYKYHRRTKDGRASKADGKTYRFFDQLQALENTNPSHSLPPPPPPLAANPITMAMPIPMRPNNNNNNNNATTNPPMPISQSPVSINPFTISQNTAPAAAAPPPPPPAPTPTMNVPILSQPPTSHIIHPQGNTIFSNSTSSSSTSSDEDIQRRHGKKRKWKELFDKLTKDVIEKQEEMQKKFLDTLEKRERERVVREETWRVQEMARMNREHDLLIQERSMAAAKDATIIAFLQKITEQQNIQIPNTTNNASPIQIPLSEKPLVAPPQKQTPPPPPPPTTPAPAVAASMPMTMHTPIPTQAPPLPLVKFEAPKTDNGGENFSRASSSRWPKEEIEALIKLRASLDIKYNDSGPKGPLWEEISAGMRELGYNRNAKRCKEKWENSNKYYKKVKESNKKRPEDSKTCPYFHQLEELYKEKAKNEAALLSNTATVFGLNSPMVAQPEQQWPLPTPQPQQPQQHQVVQGMNQDHDNDDSMDDDDEYDDDDDDEEGDAYEIVTNKQPSSMPATTTTTTAV